MSGLVRVVLVDDEPLARDLLRTLLAADAEIEVVGECSGPQAAAVIARTQPDVLFLDIQMPVTDGFAVLEQIGPGAVPAVVFVTAWAEHAIRAFEVHALDYLLKPVDESRFFRALARAKDHARTHRRGQLDERLVALLHDRRGPSHRFLVRTGDRTIVLDDREIDWIEAADYYAALHVGGRSHLIRETMAELEARLDPARFVRVHRSAIVNVERVREIHPLFRGDCELTLHSGARVRLSRTRRAAFERLFEPPSGRRF